MEGSTDFSVVQTVRAFDFGIDFQKILLWLMIEDAAFGMQATKYVQVQNFTNEALQWGYKALVDFQDKYRAMPPLGVLMEMTKTLPLEVQPYYKSVLHDIEPDDTRAVEWVRDLCKEFVFNNIFAAAVRRVPDAYNKNRRAGAREIMRVAMREIDNQAWDGVDRCDFFESFNTRMSNRLSTLASRERIPTGIHELDEILRGGLAKGEVGVWIADAKRGKSTMLVNHGVQAIRRFDCNVLHFVLEGSRDMVEARYDTIFSQQPYNLVKVGQLPPETIHRMHQEYSMYQRRLIIRGMTDEWSYNVEDLQNEISALWQERRWRPDLVIVDYGDLLNARYQSRNEVEKQRSAFRDLKSLANRGYALWTATQAQRPKSDVEDGLSVLKARQIADCYDKVRSCDFLGSLNQTKAERDEGIMRLYAELYRDNEAERVIYLKADFSIMTISGRKGAQPSPLPVPVTHPLGYKAPKTNLKQLQAT